MLKRGPKPLPTAELKLRGSRWANSRPGEPEVPPVDELPPCPGWVGGAGRDMWSELGPQLVARGVMTELDLRAFAMACACWARFVDAVQCERRDGIVPGAACKVIDVAFSQTLKTLREFGLTPSSRSQVQAVKDAPSPRSAVDRLVKMVSH